MLQNRTLYTFHAPAWFADDRVALRYEAAFAQVEWGFLDEADPAQQRGRLAHPRRAYVQALWIMVEEHLRFVSQLWRYLGEHPALIWLVGFRLVPQPESRYGFDPERSLPTARHLRRAFAALPRATLSHLLAQTVAEAVRTVPAFGQVVSLDVKHIYAYVAENNPRQQVADRFNPQHRLKADPDCRLGWKADGNQQDPASTRNGEWLWGYGLGLAVSRTPDGAALVVAEQTQPFNVLDVCHGRPLLDQAVAHLGFSPRHIAADAAFDAYYMYEGRPEGGIAAIPLNLRGHSLTHWSSNQQPLCSLCQTEMTASSKVYAEKGRRVQRFRCPQCRGKHKLVVEPGARLRAQLDRHSPPYLTVYKQRTAVERVNSLASALGVDRPGQRRLSFIARRNTLISLVLNIHALSRYHQRSIKQPLSSLPP